MGMDQRLVLWFRNDLRLTDNAALQTAARMIREKQAVEVSQCSFQCHEALLLPECFVETLILRTIGRT